MEILTPGTFRGRRCDPKHGRRGNCVHAYSHLLSYSYGHAYSHPLSYSYRFADIPSFDHAYRFGYTFADRDSHLYENTLRHTNDHAITDTHSAYEHKATKRLSLVPTVCPDTDDPTDQLSDTYDPTD